MDDEAKQLLREMRDALCEMSVREAAWIEESRRNLRRLRRLVRFVLIPMLLVALVVLLWTLFSPGTSSRSRIQTPGPIQTASLTTRAVVLPLCEKGIQTGGESSVVSAGSKGICRPPSE